VEPEKCSWPKEIKIAKTLFSKYPNFMFWKWLELINKHGYKYKVNSLAYFLTEKGKVLVHNKYVFYRNFKNTGIYNPKKINLEDKKIGKDKKVNKKFKLFDFIRYGKKEKN
tara:strand:- start:1400 stop:1732 length:333 start_codon:yes stop_codon:yes gene_type:complete